MSSTRKIGSSTFSGIGFGAMGIFSFYGAVESGEERFKVLDAAHAAGCTFWDTADLYGDSEELIGKWFKRTGKRGDIFLCSKFGVRMPSHSIDGSPAYVRTATESSLKKLGVDHIDLYYLHRADPNTPIESIVGAMVEFVKAGKVKHLGLSEVSAETLRRAHAVHPIAAEYSPFSLDIEDPKIGLLAAARELRVQIVAYSPLGRGLLTGQYKSPDDFEEGDFRKMVPRFSAENFPNILKLADGLKTIGQRHRGSDPDCLAPRTGRRHHSHSRDEQDQDPFVSHNSEIETLSVGGKDVQAVRDVAVKADSKGARIPRRQ
ncbi:Aldo keto reductase [Mycena polygramma]|nr:Aldo keto reductase [Mycena polygramma]